MLIHCLGTVGYHPSADRHTSCYFLPDDGIVLDAGSGFFRLPSLIQGETLDILLSHAHLDHTFGLTFLLDVLYQCPVARVRVWGELEKLDAVQKHLFSPLMFPVPIDVEWMPIDDLPVFQIGGCQISWRRQPHPGGSVGYRLDWPAGEAETGRRSNPAKRLVYLTDTTGEVSAEAQAWAQGADLLMHECYFRESQAEWAEKTGHSWTGRVAEIARNAGPKRLLLTHINPLESDAGTVIETSELAKLECDVALAADEMNVVF